MTRLPEFKQVNLGGADYCGASCGWQLPLIRGRCRAQSTETARARQRAANGCSGAECRETMQRRCILGWDSDIDRRRIKTLHLHHSTSAGPRGRGSPVVSQPRHMSSDNCRGCSEALLSMHVCPALKGNAPSRARLRAQSQ